MSNACATCALPFGNALDPISEKPLLPGRYLSCCGRSICSRCLNQNKRYETYCPYCQITTTPSLLPQGLKGPPAYSASDARQPPPSSTYLDDDEPPAYSTHQPVRHQISEKTVPAEDVLHFIRPEDTVLSVSLAYGVPIDVLRKTNNLFSDHLLQARKTLLVPGEYYKGGVSLSPQPLESEEEEVKKTKVRRWMVACKVAEYDVATLYLQQSEWNLEAAIDAYREDERWEKEHPLEVKSRMKNGKKAADTGMRRFVGGSGSMR
ncbi:unnamed protein product [Zymoseptoria tritici ST99CH_1E4]|uniref:LysM domain-containing protein n=1 Tax=Zymoseptoria tritici ST99CH_1E4 TaxID=1276532 RepID=A0A2H1FXU8_ZYMTR|nr:unnamed protein product [Zymoseptoria tritici ST99CH_1E4]